MLKPPDEIRQAFDEAARRENEADKNFDRDDAFYWQGVADALRWAVGDPASSPVHGLTGASA